MRNHFYVAVGMVFASFLEGGCHSILLWWLPVGQGNVTACHQLQVLQQLSREIQQMHTNEARTMFFISSNKQRNGNHQHAQRLMGL